MAPLRRRNKNEVKQALRGWVAWSPLLAVFGFMAWDAALHIKARHVELQASALAAQRRQLVQDLDQARADQARYTDIRRIGDFIRQLNMILPDPQQIQVVVARPGTPLPETGERSGENTFKIAGPAPASSGSTSLSAVPIAPAVALPVTAPSTVPAVPAAPATARATAVLVSAVAPAPAAAHAVCAASQAPKSLELPREQIMDLDSPDAPTKDLLPKL